MCDYCDCRTRQLLAQLGEDHYPELAAAGVETNRLFVEHESIGM